jgi:hypothetical protein
MATYYVQPNGADSNTGLGPATGTAWRTVQKALGATGVTSGDTVYIAPGTYRETVTVGGTYASNVNIIGDRTASQFTGISAGYIRITGLVSDALNISTYLGNFVLNGKSYLTFDSIWFEGLVVFSANTTNVNFIRCQITVASNFPNFGTSIHIDTTGQSNILIDKCFIQGGIYVYGSGNTTTTRFNASFWQSANVSTGGIECLNTGSPRITMSNLTVFGGAPGQIFRGYSPPANTLFVYNCLIVPDYATPTFGCGNTNCIVEDANVGYLTRGGGVSAGANSKQLYHRAFIGTPVYINPIDAEIMPYTPLNGDVLIGAGQPAYSFGTDFYGNAWANPPSVGASEFKSFNTISAYLPTERNASTITIAPASTSQSIELYLGATGLTFSTSGLAAYYVRNQSAPVAITLVTQTATGAWASGGFAEISSSLVPGVYRLDVPNAAFAAGASDVTIVVRGASGTNGAVLTVTLSSGGLTAAQTAAAVWDEPYTSHVTASTFGARTLKTVADNRLVNVGTANHIEANIHAVVNSTAAADELSGALLHNGSDYISAELLTPVSAATSVHIGPYQLLADGLGADQPLDVNVGTATSIDVQVTDANGTGIDITGATVTAKVYSSAGTLVASYAGTATYADNGRLSFGLTTTVTNTSGTYTVTVTRTTGATDTQIFGPLRLYVRPV